MRAPNLTGLLDLQHKTPKSDSTGLKWNIKSCCLSASATAASPWHPTPPHTSLRQRRDRTLQVYNPRLTASEALLNIIGDTPEIGYVPRAVVYDAQFSRRLALQSLQFIGVRGLKGQQVRRMASPTATPLPYQGRV